MKMKSLLLPKNNLLYMLKNYKFGTINLYGREPTQIKSMDQGAGRRYANPNSSMKVFETQSNCL